MTDHQDSTHKSKPKEPCVSKLIEEIDGRFVSGNSVPVERAHIKASEWELLKKHIKINA